MGTSYSAIFSDGGNFWTYHLVPRKTKFSQKEACLYRKYFTAVGAISFENSLEMESKKGEKCKNASPESVFIHPRTS